MKIRRYYGRDCNSIDGFNDGYYIDDEPIEVKDHDEAHEKIHEALGELWDLKRFDETEFTHEDQSIELIIGYYDSENGSEVTREKYMQTEDDTAIHYRYVYVNYEVCDE